MPLEEYTINFYQILERASESLPDKLLNVMPMMIKENWLFSYREINGIEKALERISRKLSIQNYSIASHIDELKNNYQDIENDFRSFFSRSYSICRKTDRRDRLIFTDII